MDLFYKEMESQRAAQTLSVSIRLADRYSSMGGIKGNGHTLLRVRICAA